MPAVDDAERPSHYKRIVILSDGTWQSIDSKLRTNIVRIAKAVAHEDDAGVQQVVYYDPGVGTNSGAESLTGGAMGVGIDKNIQQLYTFLAMNYEKGDEVYMFGFSRGAYTVRSLVGLIYNCGLVERAHIEFVEQAYTLYRTHVDAESDEAKQFREKHGDRVDITCLACFDTVAALGVPTALFRNFNDENYAFHDPKLNKIVQNAIHCLSIDEMRTTYKPTLMYHHPDNGPDQLTQRWFWGEHAGVGGGDDKDPLAANVTLSFMLEEMQRRGLGLMMRRDTVLPKSLDILAKQHHVDMTTVMWFQRMFGVAPRDIPSLDVVHESALQRYRELAAYRPKSLEKFKDAILGTVGN